MYLSLSLKFLIRLIQKYSSFSRGDFSLLEENPYSDNNDIFYTYKYIQSFTNSTLNSINKYINYITKN